MKTSLRIHFYLLQCIVGVVVFVGACFFTTSIYASPLATGGEETALGSETLHTFNSNGTFTVTAPIWAQVLVVGGGGSGGVVMGGGGGGGAVVMTNYMRLVAGTYPVVVGAGGAAPAYNQQNPGLNGGTSTFAGLSALGGGGGGGWSSNAGKAGGNGGGATRNGAVGVGQQGFPGGTGLNRIDVNAGSGGGGAGMAGGDAERLSGLCLSGHGGDGVPCAITGEKVYYGGGGGGGYGQSTSDHRGLGGDGGGGDGGARSKVSDQMAQDGVNGLGGGGGGGGYDGSNLKSGAGGSGVVMVRYVSDASVPVIASVAVTSSASVSLTVGGILESLGEGSDWCDLSVVIFTVGANEVTNLVGRYTSDGAAFTATISGLLPTTAYGYKIVATNAQGRVWTVSGTATTAEEVASSDLVCTPGLRQGKFGCNANQTPDFTVRIDSLSADKVDQTMGCLMAKKASNGPNSEQAPLMTNPVSGQTWKWEDYTTYYYEGYIFLQEGATYSFWSRFDDGGAIFINDEIVFNQGSNSGYDKGYASRKSYTPETTGWYPFRGYVWDWTAGKNVMLGIAALQWTTNAIGQLTDLSQMRLNDTSVWHEFEDPGDGTFLRTSQSLSRKPTVKNWTATNGVVTASLEIVQADWMNDLTAYYGETYGGADVAAWSASQACGEISADETNKIVSVTVPAGTKYLRFVASKEGYTAWSDVIVLTEAPQLVSAAVADVTAFSSTFRGSVKSFGANATSTQLYVTYQAGDDPMQASVTNVITQVGDFELTVTNLAPDTTYSAIVHLTNASGQESTLPALSFTTMGETILSPGVSCVQYLWRVGFTGEVTTVGAGETTVTLMLGRTANTLEPVTNALLTAAGPFGFVRIFDQMGDKWYYAITCSNQSGSVSWFSTTVTNSVEVFNRTTYTWKPEVTLGDWENADNWTRSDPDPRLTWPQDASCTANFTQCSTNNPVTVLIHAPNPCQMNLQCNTLNMDVTFKTAGDAVFTPAGINWIRGRVTFDDAQVRGTTSVLLQPQSTFRVINGADVSFTGEINARQASNTVEVLNGSVLAITNSVIRMGHLESRMNISNSAVYASHYYANNSSGGSATTVLSGANPQIQVRSLFRVENSNEKLANLDFNLPVGGYDDVPISRISAGNNETHQFAGSSGNNLVLNIPNTAPAAQVETATDAQLVDWTKGINTNKVVFGSLPNPESDFFYYTYDNTEKTSGKTITGIRVYLEGRATTVQDPIIRGLHMLTESETSAQVAGEFRPGGRAETGTFSYRLWEADGTEPEEWTDFAEIHSPTNGLSLSLQDLSLGTDYLLRFRGINSDGREMVAEPFAFSTFGTHAVASGSTGSTETHYGPYSIYTFTNGSETATLTVARGGYADIVVIGGGGAGGYCRGGGGGAGGLISVTNFALAAGTYTVTVGAGGAPNMNAYALGANGSDTILSNSGTELFRAYGGGGGASWENYSSGASGASGGGGCRGNRAGGAGIDGQGHAGAVANTSGNDWGGGGGGGAGEAGHSSLNQYYAGNGGAGIELSITGISQFYAGGGGGGEWKEGVAGGAGGAGGGGDGGSRDGVSTVARAGADGFGGGGGGASGASGVPSAGAAGGSGAVIVRLRTTSTEDARPQLGVGKVTPSWTTAVIDWEYFSAGQNATSCGFSVVYQAEHGFVHTNAIAGATEPSTVTTHLDGLAPNTRYTVFMLATNNLGVVGTSNSVAFQTLGEAQPGLFEVQIDGYNEYGPVDEAAKTNVVLRAVRAYAGTDPSVFPTYTTFAYLGQLYLPVGTFTFYSYCDDSARISIDGKIVCAKDVNGHQGTVTTTEPGWHDIDIRMSGAGGNNGTTDGAHFKAQGASTWQKFIDPGDGSLLRVNKTDTRLEIVSAAMMGTTLTAPVHAAIPEPADLYLCYSADYCGADANQWTIQTEPFGTTAGVTASFLARLENVPAGTRFVRVLGVPTAAGVASRYWSQTVTIEDVPEADADPIIAAISVVEEKPLQATLSVSVVSPGEGAETCDLYAAYGFSSDSLIYTNVLARGVGMCTTNVVLGGLIPEHFYSVRVYAISDADERVNVDQEAVYTLTTPAFSSDAQTVGCGVGTPGFNVGYIPNIGNVAGAYRNAGRGTITETETPGCYAAGPNGEYVFTRTNDWYVANGYDIAEKCYRVDFARKVYQQSNGRGFPDCLQDYSQMVYWGYVYMTAGETFTFAEYWNDGAIVKIDGHYILYDTVEYSPLKAGDANYHTWAIPGGNSSWSVATFGTYTAETTGWHPIEVYLGQGAGTWWGAQESNNPWTLKFGYSLGYVTNDVSSLLTDQAKIKDPPVAFQELVDPGDGSRFSTAPNFLRPIEITATNVVNGTLTADLSFGSEGDKAQSLYVVYGPVACGMDTNAWVAQGGTIRQIGSGAIPLSQTSLSGVTVDGVGTAVKYARFFFASVPEDGMSFSDTLFFTDPTFPKLSTAVEVSGVERGDRVTVTGTLLSTGGSDCTATVEISRTGDFSDAVSWPATIVNGVITAEIFDADRESPGYILPGVTQFARLRVANVNGRVDATVGVPFTTKAASALGSVSASADMWTLTYTATLATAGANETTIFLYTGSSANTMTNTASQVLTGPGTATFALTYPDFGRQMYYTFVCSNACSTVSWVSQSARYNLSTLNNAIYIWKSGVSGNWEDGANWDVIPDDPRLTYPNADTCSADFSCCTNGEVVAISASNRTRLIMTNRAMRVMWTGGATRGTVTSTQLANDLHSGSLTVRNVNFTTYGNVTLDSYSGFFLEGAADAYVNGNYILRDNSSVVVTEASTNNVNDMTVDGSNSLLRVEDNSVQTIRMALRQRHDTARIIFDNSQVIGVQYIIPNVNSWTAKGGVTFVSNSVLSAVRMHANYDYGGASGTIRLSGEKAQLRFSEHFSSINSGIPPRLQFDVPEKGYQSAAVLHTGTGATQTFVHSGSKTNCVVEVLKSSPVFKPGGRPYDVQLIDWNTGIYTGRVALVGLPLVDVLSVDKPRSYFYYTFTPGSDLPTGLHAHCEGPGGTMLIIR